MEPGILWIHPDVERTIKSFRLNFLTALAPRRGRHGCPAERDIVALFQSTPPRRGRPWPDQTAKMASVFQSTPPRRGRRVESFAWLHDEKFQSTPPRRGRPRRRRDILAAASLFQSTPPRRGRRHRRWRHGIPGSSSCFNPRPRAGGDSIRLSRIQYGRSMDLFQSTPPRRGRRRCPHRKELTNLWDLFQSTPPRRGRLSDAKDVAISAFSKMIPRLMPEKPEMIPL